MKRPGIWTILWQLLKLLSYKKVVPPPGLEEMVRRRLDAMSLSDAEAYRRTVHPETLALAQPGVPNDCEIIMKKELGKKVPPDFTLSAVSVGPNDALFMDKYLKYPVRPSHAVKVGYKPRPGSHSTLFWYVGEKEGQWYVILPEPHPGMEAWARKAAAGKEAKAKHVEDLYYNADPALLTEMRELLRKKQKIEAIRRAGAKLKLDTVTAKDFVEKIEATV
jgi:hypothetical protein